MRGLKLQLQRHLRALLACLVFSLALAPAAALEAPGTVLAALSHVRASATHAPRRLLTRSISPDAARRQAGARTAARRHVRGDVVSGDVVPGAVLREALRAGEVLRHTSREPRFEGRRLYLDQLALLC